MLEWACPMCFILVISTLFLRRVRTFHPLSDTAFELLAASPHDPASFFLCFGVVFVSEGAVSGLPCSPGPCHIPVGSTLVLWNVEEEVVSTRWTRASCVHLPESFFSPIAWSAGVKGFQTRLWACGSVGVYRVEEGDREVWYEFVPIIILLSRAWLAFLKQGARGANSWRSFSCLFNYLFICTDCQILFYHSFIIILY